jgi:hypothetical protein
MVAMLILAVACAPAWRPGAIEPLSLEPPLGWTVASNYRLLGVRTVVLRRERASITVQMRPDRGAALEGPLDLVASTRALSWGRRVGVENAILAEHQLLVADREAWAMTGIRRLGPVSIAFSSVTLRNCEALLELTLHAPGSELNRWSVDWMYLLTSVRLADPAPAEAPLFEEDGWLRRTACTDVGGSSG